jgi:cysteine synthase B
MATFALIAGPMPHYKTLEEAIGHTPLVRLQRLPGEEIASRGNVILGKLEGNNPAGSVKDRPAINMIRRPSCAARSSPATR